MNVIRMIAQWLGIIAIYHGLGLLFSADFMRDFSSFMFDPYTDFWSVHGGDVSDTFTISNAIALYQSMPDAGKIICWLVIASVVFAVLKNVIRASQFFASFFIALLIFRVAMWAGNVSGFAWPDTRLILYAAGAVLWLIVLALGSGGTLRERIVDVWRRFTT